MMRTGGAAVGGPEAGPLWNDPVCRITNGIVRVQDAGTRRMVALLAQMGKSADPTKTKFLNDRLIPVLRQEIDATADPRQKSSLRLKLGREWMFSGRPVEALREFDATEEALRRMGARFGGSGAREMRMSRSVAWLRLGEQENCLTNHHADSCILPIRGGAIHGNTRGSRGAVATLTEQLEATPEDLAARWLLNIAYMTLGEWPDKVPARWLIPPKVFASEHDLGRFPDVAGGTGLDVNDLAGGCVLDDFDNDGLIDVVASAWGLDGQLRLFRNMGDGTFMERTVEAGLTGIVGGLNIQQTDFDNDGWMDLWVLRGGWWGTAGRFPNSLLRNNGDGTFSDVTEAAGLLSFHPTQTSAWFDYDGDGWLDLFVGNETWDRADPDPCELFHNNRDGTFTECAAETGLAVHRLVKGVACGDYDNDGRPDLFLSCRSGANLLFRNTGPAGTNAQGKVTSKFENTSRAAGVFEELESFPTWFFDYDNDGREDLFVSGYLIRHVGDVAADYLGLPHQGRKLRLYRNLGDGTFTNVTEAVHLDRLCHTMGSNFGDFDNDGWLDFYLGTGDPDFATIIPNRAFRNAGGRFFQEVTTSTGLGHLQKGHGVAFADLDNDGDQDVYLVAGGAYSGDRYPNALFENPGHGGHWLKLHLRGVRSNRAAIGARIAVTVETPAGARIIRKTVNSGGSFGSNPLRQELGLGDASGIRQVEIYWPASGVRQVIPGTALGLDRCYRVVEGVSGETNRVREIVLPRFALKRGGRMAGP